jgi:hypothetical protein
METSHYIASERITRQTRVSSPGETGHLELLFRPRNSLKVWRFSGRFYALQRLALADEFAYITVTLSHSGFAFWLTRKIRRPVPPRRTISVPFPSRMK